MDEKKLPKPVDWDELYPGRFLKAGDFKGNEVTLTIARVEIEELVGDKGPQIKGVISFEKTEKQLALNKTNGLCLREMFGRKVQEWVGHKVTLFPAIWNGEPCIRVFGSPELDADKDVTIALPRRRPYEMTMHAIKAKAASSDAPSDSKLEDLITAFDDASSPDELASVEEMRAGMWNGFAPDAKRRVMAASEAATKRVYAK